MSRDDGINVRLRCDQCGNKFYAKTAYPECCPICGAEREDDPGDVISMPALRSATTATPDKVFREMEEKSIARAEAAASMAGVPVAEMSHLKITDLRDNVKDGETYAKPVQVPSNMQGKWVGGGPEYGAAAASGAVTVNGQTMQGVHPRAGMRYGLDHIQKLNGRGG
jgi:hypothetical protein